MLPRLEARSWLLIAVAGWALACAIVGLSGFGGHYTLLPDDPKRAQALPVVALASSHSQMLGFLEQSTVYNAINFSFAPAQALNLAYYTNSTILYTRLDLFICPSDGVSPTTVASARLDFNCNYVGSTGTTSDCSIA